MQTVVLQQCISRCRSRLLLVLISGQRQTGRGSGLGFVVDLGRMSVEVDLLISDLIRFENRMPPGSGFSVACFYAPETGGGKPLTDVVSWGKCLFSGVASDLLLIWGG